MAMNPSDPTPRSWDRLTSLARQAPVPEIDVSLAVLRAIKRAPAPQPVTIFDSLASLLASGWLSTSVAAIAALATFVGVKAFESADAVLLALGFSI